MRVGPGAWLRPATGEVPAHPALMAEAAQAGAVLLGESHDRADHHRWQLSVLAGLLAHRVELVVGFEMFPARADPVLADWVAGGMDEATFLPRVGWDRVWGFGAELYLPLFHFCRQHRLAMIGLNCDRDLVRQVGANGWEAIPEPTRDGITPAAPATAAYRHYLFDMTGGRREGRAAQHPMDPAFDRFVRAQQTWDRAFACRIAAVSGRGQTGPKSSDDVDTIGQRDKARKAGTGARPIAARQLASSASPAAAPLIVGIIGRGHLEFGGGTPHQLADLGITDAMVLLPVEAGAEVAPGIADAVFGLDPPGGQTGRSPEFSPGVKPPARNADRP